MNKLTMLAAGLSLAAVSGVEAGPLDRANGVAAPRLASHAMPVLPRLGTLSGMAPACQPRCGGGTPLDEPWIQYNLNQYPVVVQGWANDSLQVLLGLGGGTVGPVPLPKLPGDD